MQCRTAAPRRARTVPAAANSGRPAARLRAPPTQARCQIPIDNTAARRRASTSRGGAADGCLLDLCLGDRDRRDLPWIDAVLHGGDLGENRDRDLGRSAAADVKPDGTVQARDLVVAQIELAQPLAALRVVGARPQCTDVERARFERL